MKRAVANVLLVLISCALTIGIAELALALFFPVPFSIETNTYFVADPYTGYRLKPGAAGHYQLGIPAVANSQGNRDVDVPVIKPPGVFRILVIGDSFTVGANVQQSEAYAKVLERQLVAKYGPNIQVINSGVGGWSPFQYAQYFEHYGRAFEPNLILVGFFVGNDTLDQSTVVSQLGTAILGHIVSPQASAQPWIGLEVFLYEHSNLARLLLNRGSDAQRTVVRDRCDDFTSQYLAIQQDRVTNHLLDSPRQRSAAQNAVNQIARIASLAGSVPVVVALLPDENQLNAALQKRVIPANDMAKYDFNMPQSMLVDMFNQASIRSINLLPAFRADKRCLYMNDTHWAPDGHKLAASVIYDQLGPILAQMLKSAPS